MKKNLGLHLMVALTIAAAITIPFFLAEFALVPFVDHSSFSPLGMALFFGGFNFLIAGIALAVRNDFRLPSDKNKTPIVFVMLLWAGALNAFLYFGPTIYGAIAFTGAVAVLLDFSGLYARPRIKSQR